MTYEFFTITGEFEEIVLAKATYKTQNKIVVRLAKEANKLFGLNNWEQVPNYSNTLDNIAGWYARRKEGDDTLDTRIV